jgi:uncharacterized membrane protein
MTPLVKRLGIFLAVSIGLNLLLGGFWLGRGLRGHGPHPHGFAPPHGSAEIAGRRHPMLRQAFDAKAPEFSRHREAARAARRRVAQCLERQPFDRAELESALGALRKENLSSQELFHSELAGLAERGSPDVRRDIARTFMRDRP